MRRTPFRRLTATIVSFVLLFMSTSGVAFANAFEMSISSPTNNPVWTSGNPGSVSWTWFGGPLPAARKLLKLARSHRQFIHRCRIC